MHIFIIGFSVSFMVSVFLIIGLIASQNELHKSRDTIKKMGQCLIYIDETITKAENYSPGDEKRDYLVNDPPVPPNKVVWLVRKHLEWLEHNLDTKE